MKSTKQRYGIFIASIILVVLLLSSLLFACDNKIEETDVDGDKYIKVDPPENKQAVQPDGITLFYPLFTQTYEIGDEFAFDSRLTSGLDNLVLKNKEDNIKAAPVDSIYALDTWEVPNGNLKLPYGYSVENGNVEYLYWGEDVKTVGFDTSTVGEKTLEIIKGERKAYLSYTVKEKGNSAESDSTEYELTIEPMGKYYLGENVENAKASVFKKNDNSTTVIGSVKLTGVDTSSLGEKILSVPYEGKELEYKYCVYNTVGASFGNGLLKKYSVGFKEINNYPIPLFYILDDEDATLKDSGQTVMFSATYDEVGKKSFEGRLGEYTAVYEYEVLDVIDVKLSTDYEKYYLGCQYRLVSSEGIIFNHSFNNDILKYENNKLFSILSYTATYSDGTDFNGMVEVEDVSGLKEGEYSTPITLYGKELFYHYSVVGVADISIPENWKKEYCVGESYKAGSDINNDYSAEIDYVGYFEKQSDSDYEEVRQKNPSGEEENNYKVYFSDYYEKYSSNLSGDGNDDSFYYQGNYSYVNRIAHSNTTINGENYISLIIWKSVEAEIVDEKEEAEKRKYADYYLSKLHIIYVTYDDGSVCKLNVPTTYNKNIDITGFDSSTSGDKEMILSFFGREKKIPYTVYASAENPIAEAKDLPYYYSKEESNDTNIGRVSVKSGEKEWKYSAGLKKRSESAIPYGILAVQIAGRPFFRLVEMEYKKAINAPLMSNPVYSFEPLELDEKTYMEEASFEQWEEVSSVSIIVTYEDFTRAIVKVPYKVDTSKVGEHKVFVSYAGQNIEYKYFVSGLESITVSTDNIILQGEDKIDYLSLNITYGNSGTYYSRVNIDPIETDFPGVGQRKVTYTRYGKDYEIIFDYEIVSNGIDYIEPYTIASSSDSKYTPTTYLHTDNDSNVFVSRYSSKFHSYYFYVMVHYLDGTSKVIGVSNFDYENTNIDCSKLGEFSHTINYLNKSCVLNYTVIPIESYYFSKNNRTRYARYEGREKSRLYLFVTGGDITLTLYTDTYNIDTGTYGEKELSFTYLNQYEFIYEYEVCEIESISLLNEEDAIRYEGDSSLSNSLNVIIHWADGKTSNETVIIYKEIDDEIVGSRSLRLSYYRNYFDYNYTVYAVENVTVPDLTITTENKIYSANVMVEYSDGKSKERRVSLDDNVIIDLPGKYSCDFDYLGRQLTLNYTVLAPSSVSLGNISQQYNGRPYWLASDENRSNFYIKVEYDGMFSNIAVTLPPDVLKNTTPGSYSSSISFRGIKFDFDYDIVDATFTIASDAPMILYRGWKEGHENNILRMDNVFSYEISLTNGKIRHEKASIFGFSTDKAGDFAYDLYLSEIRQNKTINYTVIDIESITPSISDFTQNEDIKTLDLSILYKNGESKEITIVFSDGEGKKLTETVGDDQYYIFTIFGFAYRFNYNVT